MELVDHEAVPLAQPGPEGDAPTGSFSGEADDIPVHFVAPARIAHAVRRRADAVRIGRLVLPGAAVAWGISLTVHGAVILVGWLAVRFYFSRPALPLPWGGGGGGGGVIIAGADSTMAVRQGLPDVPPAAPQKARARTAQPTEQAVPVVGWTDHRTLASLESDRQLPIIGVLGTKLDVGGPTLRNHPAPKHDTIGRAAPGQVKAAQSGGSPAPQGNGGKTTMPGLPGVLLREGLPMPDYPLEARSRGEQGTVEIEVEVLPDGKLRSIRVVRGPDYPLLRQAALAAAEKLRSYRFVPACRFGRPVRAALMIPYQFVLK